MELRKRDYILVDTETTGYSEEENQILEIAIMVIKNLEVTNKLELKIKHKKYTVTPGALKVNGIDLVKHDEVAMGEEDAAKRILEFLKDNKSEEIKEGYIVIGQNVSFDIKFIEKMFLRNKLIRNYRELVSYRNLDIMQMALIKNLEGYIELEKQDLDSIAESLDIDIPKERHSAAVDCELTYRVLIELLNIK